MRCTSSSQNLKWACCQQRPFGLIWPGLCWQLAFLTFCENDVRLTCSSRGLINDRADKGTVHQFASCSLGIWSAKFQFCSTDACGVYYVSVAAPQLRVPIGVKTFELWRVVGAEACRERLDVESNPLVENSSTAPRRKARRELCENHQCLRPRVRRPTRLDTCEHRCGSAQLRTCTFSGPGPRHPKTAVEAADVCICCLAVLQGMAQCSCVVSRASPWSLGRRRCPGSHAMRLGAPSECLSSIGIGAPFVAAVYAVSAAVRQAAPSSSRVAPSPLPSSLIAQ